MSRRGVGAGAAAGTVQVTETLAEAPSFATLICALPAAWQVTRPALFTVRDPKGAIVHTTEEVTSTGAALPVVSNACNCNVWLTALSVVAPLIARLTAGEGCEVEEVFDEAVKETLPAQPTVKMAAQLDKHILIARQRDAMYRLLLGVIGRIANYIKGGLLNANLIVSHWISQEGSSPANGEAGF